jgi:hypothetical protein
VNSEVLSAVVLEYVGCNSFYFGYSVSMFRTNVLPPCLILLKNIRLRLHREFIHVANSERCLRSDTFRARELDSKATRFNDPLLSNSECPCTNRWTFKRRLETRVENRGIAGVFHVAVLCHRC